MNHVFDPRTCYCLRCGKAMQFVVEFQQKECHATPNVIAISHILSARRIDRLINMVIR